MKFGHYYIIELHFYHFERLRNNVNLSCNNVMFALLILPKLPRNNVTLVAY